MASSSGRRTGLSALCVRGESPEMKELKMFWQSLFDWRLLHLPRSLEFKTACTSHLVLRGFARGDHPGSARITDRRYLLEELRAPFDRINEGLANMRREDKDIRYPQFNSDVEKENPQDYWKGRLALLQGLLQNYRFREACYQLLSQDEEWKDLVHACHAQAARLHFGPQQEKQEQRPHQPQVQAQAPQSSQGAGGTNTAAAAAALPPANPPASAAPNGNAAASTGGGEVKQKSTCEAIDLTLDDEEEEDGGGEKERKKGNRKANIKVKTDESGGENGAAAAAAAGEALRKENRGSGVIKTEEGVEGGLNDLGSQYGGRGANGGGGAKGGGKTAAPVKGGGVAVGAKAPPLDGPKHNNKRPRADGDDDDGGGQEEERSDPPFKPLLTSLKKRVIDEVNKNGSFRSTADYRSYVEAIAVLTNVKGRLGLEGEVQNVLDDFGDSDDQAIESIRLDVIVTTINNYKARNSDNGR